MSFNKAISFSFIFTLITCIALGPIVGDGFIFLAIFAFIAYMILFAIIAAKIDKRNQGGLGNFDPKKKELEVIDFHPNNNKKLKLEKVLLGTAKYLPATVTYTGATVGGIHTGGFHYEDAAYDVGLKKSEKYKITYFINSGDNHPYIDVEKFKLSDNMLEKAKKNSFISKFLDGNYIVPKYDISNDKTLETLTKAYAMDHNDELKMLAVANYSLEHKSLTKEDAQRIIDWLCGA